MPVYNAEKSLADAIDSVIKQTYKEWELIVVDDKSTDNSLEIVKHFAKYDKRIKVLSNPENLGPAYTRNKGLENAQGEYIGFIDADDQYENNFIQKMIECAMLYKVEIVWCQYIEKKSEKAAGIKISHCKKVEYIVDKKEILDLFFCKTPGIAPVWNKIYCKKFIDKNKISFNNDRVRAEDWEFNLTVFEKANSIVIIPDTLYSYLHNNPNSVMSTIRLKDYFFIWRSINLLQIVNENHKLGKSRIDIYSINAQALLEVVYNLIKKYDYKEINGILGDNRLKEVLIEMPSLQNIGLRHKLLKKSILSLNNAITFILFKWLI